MKIYRDEIIILNVTAKKKQDGSDYVAIGFASASDGSPFTVLSTNMDYLKLEPFSKHLADFTIIDSKYGMRLTLDNLE